MTKKILILGIVISCFLLFSATASVLADELETLIDQEDDVVDDELETTDEKPNIDIVEIKYSKEDQSTSATMTLKVKGEIEDSESLEDIDDLTGSIVMYIVEIETSDSTYEIAYASGECTVNDVNATYIKDGSTLAVTFDLDSANETYTAMQAISTEMDFTTFLSYADSVPDIFLKVTANGPTKAKTGKTIEFTGDVSKGTSPYEYKWDFDDGSTSTEQNPTHSYSEDGTYTITLEVSDKNGAIGSDFFDVEISKDGGGDTNDNSNNGLLIFIALMLVVVIAGAAVLFYVLKR